MEGRSLVASVDSSGGLEIVVQVSGYTIKPEQSQDKKMHNPITLNPIGSRVTGLRGFRL